VIYDDLQAFWYKGGKVKEGIILKKRNEKESSGGVIISIVCYCLMEKKGCFHLFGFIMKNNGNTC